ncbi:unnamed protein product [Notodromas monacha]|uniref:Pantothenate kinase 2 n=1 Tax=Notodromas monacha TaxID=399045 RepID=A0A7R9BTW0_9CRUS|nr:unnamed protein product [Notodromas monacha]CAG0920640.1 unnamed protein product [Notodromas monacha]
MSTASERVVPIGVDIGGTLAKLVIFCPDDASLNSDGLSEQLCRMVLDNETYKKTGVRDSGLRLDKTAEFESMLGSFAKRSQSNSGTSVGPEVISATGGGAFKFEESIRVQLRRRLRKMDELSAVVRGISALESLYPDEVYCLDQRLFGLLQEPVLEDTCLENGKIRFHLAQSYPYLVVNVGSGVSILCCQGADRFERVSGSSLGGGTFLGLCALLTDCNTFEEALKLASQGDNTKVDKLVRDIYGGDYER